MVRHATGWGGPCILIDGQYDLATWTGDLRDYYLSLGWCCRYYSDVRGASFDLNRFSLIILSLPDIADTDGFVAEQWSGISAFRGKRIYIGTDWQGEGTYELAVSDTTNDLGTGMLVLDDFGVAPVASGDYAPETDDLTSGVTNLTTTAADEISGGTNLCDDGTTSFLRKNTSGGIKYVMCGTPGLTGQMTTDNKTFFRNLVTVA